MLVLFIVTFIDALVHQCYFQWTSPFLERAGCPANWIMPAMSIGQIAEIATMAVLGPGAATARLADDDGHRDRRTCGAVLRLRHRRAAVADGRHQRRARHVLRVLLRRRLHLRGRALPEARARQRPGPVQPADPRTWTVRRELAVGCAGRPLPHSDGRPSTSNSCFWCRPGSGLLRRCCWSSPFIRRNGWRSQMSRCPLQYSSGRS